VLNTETVQVLSYKPVTKVCFLLPILFCGKKNSVNRTVDYLAAAIRLADYPCTIIANN